MGVRIVERAERGLELGRAGNRPARPSLDTVAALAAARDEVEHIQRGERDAAGGGVALCPLQARQPGHREDDRVEVAGGEARKARVHVAAQRDDVEVGAQAQRLEAPAYRRRAQPGAARQRGD